MGINRFFNKAVGMLLLLALLGCRGGGSSHILTSERAYTPQLSEQGLVVSTSEYNGYPVVDLFASGIDDLYQIAGAIKFPSDIYTIERIEAGGGLGGPGESFFVGRESSPGNVDFAYTKRYFGPGESGSIRIIRLVLSPAASVNESDFSLDYSPGKLLLRDSGKSEIKVSQAGGAQ